eukprot:1808110-Prymnesium_polylepis.1
MSPPSSASLAPLAGDGLWPMVRREAVVAVCRPRTVARRPVLVRQYEAWRGRQTQTSEDTMPVRSEAITLPCVITLPPPPAPPPPAPPPPTPPPAQKRHQ